MFKTFIDCGIFAGFLMIFATIVEFFGFGSFFGIHIFNPATGEFFRSITFKLVLLGLITIIADSIYRFRQKRVTEKKITYEKYVRRIRDEKMFIYDDFRRKKLLTSQVEIHKVNQDFVDELNQKDAENLSLEEHIKESTKDDEDSATKQDKNKKTKTKLKINVERQEKEKLSAKKAKEKAMRERGEFVEEDEKGKKGKKKGKDKDKNESNTGAKVERVFGKKGDKKN